MAKGGTKGRRRGKAHEGSFDTEPRTRLGMSDTQIAGAISSFGGDNRLLQDSPVQNDVWAILTASRYNERTRWKPLLITPHDESTAARVAQVLDQRLERYRDRERPGPGAALDAWKPVSVPGVILAWMTLEEVAAVVLPMTFWWRSADPATVAGLRRRQRVIRLINWLLAGCPESWSRSTTEAGTSAPPDGTDSPAARLLAYLDPVTEDERRADAELPLIRRVARERSLSSNSTATAAMAKAPASRVSDACRTIKADAARQLFSVNCSRLRWAVIDSGISLASGGFGEGPDCRVDRAYDFARLAWWLHRARQGGDTVLIASVADTLLRRDLVLARAEAAAHERAHLAASAASGPAGIPDLAVVEAARDTDADLANARKDAQQRAEQRAVELVAHLKIRLETGRDFDWEMLEPVLEIDPVTPPIEIDGEIHSHGTKVASILAADHPALSGICPDLRLLDIRVVSGWPERREEDGDSAQPHHFDTEFVREFDVIAALRFLRFLNAREQRMYVHGANLSLQTPHDVVSYGCGATLLCEEVDRSSNDGLVVVVASGNDGHRVTADVHGKEASAYVGSSITDPGNAEEAITVGSTHRRDPHRYGVSYFSGRGPTGDGRRKPDLVAPGEKIEVLTPTGGQEAEVDGTSFAAPHVSGAAAMLMARYPELIGRPRRIKQLLMGSATDLGRTHDFQGAGLLDVLRAMQSL